MKAKQYVFSTSIATVDQLAAQINHNTTFYHRINRNADGTPQRWRVNGELKRWKRDSMRMRLPIKHGMYHYDAIESLADFNTYLALSYEESL